VNFRASGKTDVAKLAYFFNGGGHRNASGCRIAKPLKKARAEVFKQIRQLLL
jgi:phosphoesterase RecJ-like protein